MNLHDFYYDLPKELIAQDPLEDRSSSKLLVVNKNTGELKHDIFQNITDDEIETLRSMSRKFQKDLYNMSLK